MDEGVHICLGCVEQIAKQYPETLPGQLGQAI